jgi:hypothetical protein
MYYDPKTLDLKVMQKEAEEGAKGDRMKNYKPVGTTIHHHKRNEICTGKVHQEFDPKE